MHYYHLLIIAQEINWSNKEIVWKSRVIFNENNTFIFNWAALKFSENIF